MFASVSITREPLVIAHFPRRTPRRLQQPPQVEDFLAIAHEDEQRRGLIRKRPASAAREAGVVPTGTRFAPTYTTECRASSSK